MGEPRPVGPVKLIAGVLAATSALLDDAQAALADQFGAIDAASAPARWTESTYYTAEMGAELWRQYLSFDRLIEPGALAALKLWTNAIEGTWRVPSGRRVNIDPGYLNATKLVLASTKDAAQRVFLADGIYAEATLRFADGAWHRYAYTYRDYASPVALAFFSAVRARFLAQRRAG